MAKRKLSAGIHLLSISPDATREEVIANLAEFCDMIQYGPFKYIGDELRTLIKTEINPTVDFFIKETVKSLPAATLRNHNLLIPTILNAIIMEQTDIDLIKAVSKLPKNYPLLAVNDLVIFPECCQIALDCYERTQRR